MNVLLSEKQLKEEIHHLEQNKQLRSQLTAALAWAERDGGGAVNCRRQSTDPNLDSERLRLLLKWCKTVCGLYGMKVRTFLRSIFATNYYLVHATALIEKGGSVKNVVSERRFFRHFGDFLVQLFDPASHISCMNVVAETHLS